jgi:hypothetical protein
MLDRISDAALRRRAGSGSQAEIRLKHVDFSLHRRNANKLSLNKPVAFGLRQIKCVPAHLGYSQNVPRPSLQRY